MYRKKVITASGGYLRHSILSARLKHFYKQAICLGSVLSMTVYAWVRLLFHDFPFEIAEETTIILRSLLAGWVLAAACIASIQLILFVADNYAKIMCNCKLQLIAAGNLCKKYWRINYQSCSRSAGSANIKSPEATIRF